MDWDKYSKNLFVIQTHNQPDADAICSAYLLQRLLAIKGKKSVITFGGQLAKAEYNELINALSMTMLPLEDLLLLVRGEPIVHVTVDCLPNGKNVEALPQSLSILDTFAFDHHKHDLKVEPANYIINSQLKSCTVLLYTTFRNELNIIHDSNAFTAFYYGLQRDTNNFEQSLDPLSRQVKSELEQSGLLNEKMLQSLESNCISADDLNRIHHMVSKRQFLKEYSHVCYVVAEDNTDQNILGKTADLIIGATGTDIAVLMSYQEQSRQTRLSVRSLDRFFSAIEIVRTIGEGGGHGSKAGGVLKSQDIGGDLAQLMDSYYLIEAGMKVPDLPFKSYIRRSDVVYVYIPLYKIYDKGTVLETHSGKRLLVDSNVAIVNPDGSLYTMDLNTFNQRFDEIKDDDEGSFIDLPILLNRVSVAVTMRAVLKRPGPPLRAAYLDKKAKVITHVDRYYSEEADRGDVLMVWDNGHIATLKPHLFEKIYCEFST